jgi:aryl-alcohol dehydrogenase-like predicted oxidoreductase
MTDTNFYFPAKLIKGLFYDQHATGSTIQKLRDLAAIAEKEGFKLTHLALAWAVKYRHTSAVLLGARTVAQLEDSLRAVDLLEKWTPEFEARVNKVLDTTPTPRMNFLKWAPKEPARPVAKEEKQ